MLKYIKCLDALHSSLRMHKAQMEGPMLIKIIDPTAAREHEVTPQALYLDRRRLMASTARSMIAAGVSGVSGLMSSMAFAAKAYEKVPKGSPFDTNEALTPFKRRSGSSGSLFNW
jgi:hypothetical protein